MIEIYSNQETPDILPAANEVVTDNNDWWMVYDANSRKILVPPERCEGGTSTPFTFVKASTKEELEQYITDNNLEVMNSNL